MLSLNLNCSGRCKTESTSFTGFGSRHFLLKSWFCLNKQHAVELLNSEFILLEHASDPLGNVYMQHFTKVRKLVWTEAVSIWKSIVMTQEKKICFTEYCILIEATALHIYPLCRLLFPAAQGRWRLYYCSSSTPKASFLFQSLPSGWFSFL